MKKSVMTSWIAVILLTACQKRVEIPPTKNTSQEKQQPSRCGMKEAMANLSPEIRSALASKGEATTFQAAELLLFLDFDGAFVRPGFPNPTGSVSSIVTGVRYCPQPSLTQAQIIEIIELVKDDYSPFKIQVTTDQAVFDAYTPTRNKELCIITTVPSVIGMPSGVGGVAPWYGPGIRAPYDPSFVFANLYGGNLRDIALTVSQEVAHTFGLDHQHYYNEEDCHFIFEYHPGFGTGPLSFAPIMGGGFNKRISNWYGQSCEVQNDFVFLNNQVELKPDDFPDSPTGNTSINANEINGVLEQTGDMDFMRINFRNPGPVTISSENIDIKVSLYTMGGHLLAEYDDPDDTNVTIPSANGMRYLKIEAVSNANMSSQFMTGQYKVFY